MSAATRPNENTGRRRLPSGTRVCHKSCNAPATLQLGMMLRLTLLGALSKSIGGVAGDRAEVRSEGRREFHSGSDLGETWCTGRRRKPSLRLPRRSARHRFSPTSHHGASIVERNSGRPPVRTSWRTPDRPSTETCRSWPPGGPQLILTYPSCRGGQHFATSAGKRSGTSGPKRRTMWGDFACPHNSDISLFPHRLGRFPRIFNLQSPHTPKDHIRDQTQWPCTRATATDHRLIARIRARKAPATIARASDPAMRAPQHATNCDGCELSP